jgi:transcriptional regulator with GAF, ATPase, and Fis domain
MAETHAVQDWGARLKACTSPKEAASRLCEAICELLDACVVAVFLFDQSRESLLLTGLFPPRDEEEPSPGAVPSWQLEDPLAFSAHSGQTCSVPLELRSSPAPSIRTVGGGRPGRTRCALTAPLVAPANLTIGAVLALLPEQRRQLSLEVRMLCDYGAAALDLAIWKRRHSGIVHGLREDIDRLERRAVPATARPENSIIGQSEAMETIRSMVLTVSGSDVPVLVTGETGTGKEVVTAAIHAASPRRQGPFVKINCAALPANLMESELFGHRRGAFSGAAHDHEGLFRSANGGTVLLDEVGEMSPETQAKLLRVLQEHTVRPVGDVRSLPVNIRILAATNADLEAAVAEGSFRRDLYHRLAVFRMKLPPLRERTEDLPLLARHHLASLAERYRRPRLSIAPEAWAGLRSLPYPGNVREFFSILERAVIMAKNGRTILGAKDFADPGDFTQPGSKTLADLVNAYETAVILETMRFYDGKTQSAATALCIPKRTLNHKLQRIKAS